MGNSTNGDPILRVVLVMFIGLLVFSFLFGNNFGSMGNGHHGMAAGLNSGGFFFGNVITGLIGFLMHLLVLVLVFLLIAGLIAGIRKLVTQQGGFLASSKAMDYINQDPVLKTMSGALVVVFVFYFLAALFNGQSFMGVGFGISPQFMLLTLIGFLIKLLTLVLVLTLTLALFQYLKTQVLGNQQTGQQASQQQNTSSYIAPETQPTTSLPAYKQNTSKPGDKNEGK